MDGDYFTVREIVSTGIHHILCGIVSNQKLRIDAMKSSDYKKKIGERIQRARKAKDWTLAQLHAKLGYYKSSSRLGNYEAGLRTPPPWEAHLLANALGVKASYLLCLDDEESMLTTEEEKLLRYWRALPENERRATASSIEVQALRYVTAAPDVKVATPARVTKLPPAHRRRQKSRE